MNYFVPNRAEVMQRLKNVWLEDCTKGIDLRLKRVTVLALVDAIHNDGLDQRP